MKRCQVIIIGAGPVGLMLANFLADHGHRVLVLDSRAQPPATSQAIGITPPSLHLFARLGLDARLIGEGIPIHEVQVHGQSGYLGCASFRHIDPPYRYILSLPQRMHMQALEERLAGFPHVELMRGTTVEEVKEVAGDTAMCLTNNGEFHASYVVGCDGHRSVVREAMGTKQRRTDYGCHFVMGDFRDHSGLAGEAHLWFTATGAVESFPLPQGLRRWIVQLPESQQAEGFGVISHWVRERTRHALPVEDQVNQSAFSPWRLDCSAYHRGRLILCGDAAHVMSPIGGQGMNTGWADAEFLAEALNGIFQGRYAPMRILDLYEKCRRSAATAAAGRAARGMGLGTWTGRGKSLLRDVMMRQFLFKGPLASRLGPFFAMQTLPFNSLAKVPKELLEKCRVP